MKRTIRVRTASDSKTNALPATIHPDFAHIKH